MGSYRGLRLMSRRVPRLSGVVVVAILCCTRASAQQPVQYKLSFPAPEHHYAQVEVTFTGVAGGTLEARMSRSSPGRYAVHEFAKNVFDVHAFDGKGKELTPTRPNPYQWNVAGHDGTVRIVYKVFGDHVDGTYLADRHVARAHEHAGDADVGAGLRHAAGARSRSSRRRGYSWKPATQLFPTDDPWTFTAPNLQYLMDSPTELSDYTLRSFKVRNPDGKEFTIRDGRPSRRRPTPTSTSTPPGAEKIVNEAAAVFGEFPDVRHRHLHVPRRLRAVGRRRRHGASQQHGGRVADVVQESAGTSRGALGTVSHEFFHCWNVERIRPKTLEPFNFEEANISGELWLAEGFTQYYGPLIMARAGLSPREIRAGLVRNAASPSSTVRRGSFDPPSR